MHSYYEDVVHAAARSVNAEVQPLAFIYIAHPAVKKVAVIHQVYGMVVKTIAPLNAEGYAETSSYIYIGFNVKRLTSEYCKLIRGAVFQ